MKQASQFFRDTIDQTEKAEQYRPQRLLNLIRYEISAAAFDGCRQWRCSIETATRLYAKFSPDEIHQALLIVAQEGFDLVQLGGGSYVLTW